MTTAFAPTSYKSFTAIGSGIVVELPDGDGQSILVTNLGPSPVILALGDRYTRVADSGQGVALCPLQSLMLSIGYHTHLAALALGFGNAQINLARGVIGHVSARTELAQKV